MIALWRRPAFHVWERRRKAPHGKAHVNLTSFQPLGRAAICSDFHPACFAHCPELFRVRGVNDWRGGRFELLRLVVRILASNASNSDGSRAAFAVFLGGFVFESTDSADDEGSLLVQASFRKKGKRAQVNDLR